MIKLPRLSWLSRRFLNEEGEPLIWANNRNRYNSKRGTRKTHWVDWFLHWPGNELHIEVAKPGRHGLSFMVRLDDQLSDYNAELSFGIPLVFWAFIGVRRVRWLVWLLGLKWDNGKSKWGDCRREIGFRISGGTIFIFPWIDSDGGGRFISITPLDIIFGRYKYSEHGRERIETVIQMPEGNYPATIDLYTAQWKRPRWPVIKRINRADVDIPGGIPIPGKGDNSYDLDDDAIFGLTTKAKLPVEAVMGVRKSAMRDRVKYAHINWVPTDGWPAHLVVGKRPYGGE